MSRIEAVYRLKARGDDARRFARSIAFEQTVELPEALVREDIRESVVGRVTELVESGEDATLATISYDGALTRQQLPQLLNLLYGNASMYPGIRLVDVTLPEDFLRAFRGPRFGVAGIREFTGAHGRPLLATALKPTGLSNEELAAMAGAFARGGGDLIKDDQNLVDADLDDFRRRVELCASAVSDANAATGGRCQYWPHIAAPRADLDRQLEFVRALGLHGVLMSPMVHGLDHARGLLQDHQLGLMAHPSLTGAYTEGTDHGISHRLLLGTLFRLAGADISVFPNFGGRFSYAREHCLSIRDALLAPLGDLRPAFPCPAGGMQFSNLPEMAADYGVDAMFLVGGALHGHARDLALGTSAFLDEIRSHFGQD